MNRSNLGIAAVIAAVVLFSVQDVTIKLLSDRFALHQIILIRATIACLLTVLILAPLSGGFAQLKTKRLKAQLFRGGAIVLGNMTFYLGLAILPLANAVATFFSAPLIISVLAVVLLGEALVAKRLALAVVGFIGVILVVGPSAQGLGWAALLPLIAACSYSTMQLMTRKLSTTENSVSLVFYIHLMFIASSLCIGLIAGDGRFDQFDSPSAQFFFRAWIIPTAQDWVILAGIGAINAVAGYLIGLAYVLSQAGKVAPFEYVAVPMSVFWGLMIWQQFPSPIAGLGIVLILGSGLLISLMKDTSPNQD